MRPSTESEQSPAARALLHALRSLHYSAGEPSSRSIAEAIGGTSHTTVNAALKGPRVPSWPILMKIVGHLGGDVEKFRTLWIATRESGQPTEYSSIPGSGIHGDVSVFISYARVDDEATYGRISEFTSGVATTYRSMTGLDVGLFKDTTSIRLGENWKDRIRLGLASSSILLVFASPAYLRSRMCREELAEFLAFSKSSSTSRLLIPILFAEMRRVDEQFGEDEMWRELKELQALELAHLRSAAAGSTEWVQAVELVAERIDDELSSFAGDTKTPSSDGLDDKGHEQHQELDGVLDRLAIVEETILSTTEDVLRLGQLMGDLTREVEKATPKMRRADSFAKRLGVTNRLAEALIPMADEMSSIADRVNRGLTRWSDLLTFAIGLARDSEQQTESNTAWEFIETMEGVADSGLSSLAGLDSFHDDISKAKGYSARLDRPLTKMQDAVLKIAELRGVFNGWKNDIRVLKDLDSVE